MEIYRNAYVEVKIPLACYTNDQYIVTVSKQSEWPEDSDTCYLTLSFHALGCFYEHRQFDSKGVARFDLSAYYRSAYHYDITTLTAAEGTSTQSRYNFKKPSVSVYDMVDNEWRHAQQPCVDTDYINIFANETEQMEDYNQWLKVWRPCVAMIMGSNHERVPMTKTRTHLFNPIFPHYYSFVWSPHSANDFSATVTMSINGETPTNITKPIATNEYLPSEAQFGYNIHRLNDYVDESEWVKLSRHNNPLYEAYKMEVICPQHFEPENEWMKQIDDISFREGTGLVWEEVRPVGRYDKTAQMTDRFGHLEKLTEPRKDIYLWDSRYDLSKIVCLRFVDRFGFLQQLCLDLISTTDEVKEGDTLTCYKGQEYHIDAYNMHEVGGNGAVLRTTEGTNRLTNKSHTKTYSLVLTSVPKSLADDFEALMTSPYVVWLQPADDVNGNLELTSILPDDKIVYRRVYINSTKLVENTKKQVITFSCNMTV